MKKALWDRLFPESSSKNARIYMAFVILSGLFVLFQALKEAVGEYAIGWLPLVFLTVLASSFTFTLPFTQGRNQSISVTMGDVFIFLAILLFGPSVGALTGAAEGLTMNFRAKVSSGFKQLFNFVLPAISAFCVGHVFYWLTKAPVPLDPESQGSLLLLTLQLGVCAIIYFLINTGAISIAMFLTSKGSLIQLWKENFAWTWITQFGGACVASATFHFLGNALLAIMLVAPTVLLIYFAYKVNVDRIKQTQTHLEESQTLLAEKSRAEIALQKAKEELELRVAQRTEDLTRANEQLVKEIQERTYAEEALAAEKDRLSVTLGSIGEGVITTDIEGEVVLVNRTAERITGWSQSEAFGRRLDDVYRVFDNQTRKQVLGTWKKVLLTKSPIYHRGEPLKLLSKQKNQRLVSHSAAPILGKAGKPVGVVLAFRDVTVQKRMEDEIIKAQKMESLGVLAGGIAHDFNNILAAILMKGQMGLKAESRGGSVDEYLYSICDAAQEASDLTQQLLTFAKGGDPIKKAGSIESMLHSCTRFSLRGADIHFAFNIAEDLWPAEFDKSQLNQVLNNLIINAEQAMPKGGKIVISAQNVTLSAPNAPLKLPAGEYVRVSVKDSGTGITPENLERIFEPYFSTKPQGHGLGLASVYSIIRKHGGIISVESKLGEGAEFIIYLPAVPNAVVEIGSTRKVSSLGSGRILFMDDDELILECAGELLEELGYKGITVKDGEAACKEYQAASKQGNPFDAVILDLTIAGGMGGKEAIQELRRMNPSVRAIVSSGYSADPIMATPTEYGFAAVLKKPFTIQSLANVLSEVLQVKVN